MKFAAILVARDDADLLRTGIEQLRRIGVQLIIVIDSGSTGEAIEYLAEAEQTGDVWVVHERQDVPRTTRRTSRAALARACDAEWVLFLDSDEIALPRAGSLHDLADLKVADVLSVPRFSIALGEDEPKLPEPLTTQRYDRLWLYAQPLPNFEGLGSERADVPSMRKVLEPGTLIRGSAIGTSAHGEPAAEGEDDRPWRRAIAQDLVLAHLPARSERQHLVLDADALVRLRSTDEVRSLAQVYQQPITEADSDEAWMRLAARAEPWLTATGMVSRQVHIEPGGGLKHLSEEGQYPAVLLPPNHVVKFYSRWRRGHETAEREARILGILEADPALPVPRLAAQGDLEPGLRFVVMSRVEGVTYGSLEHQVGHRERVAVATWVGDFIGALQAVPLEDEEREVGWRHFREVTRWRHAQATNFSGIRGFSPRLIERLPGWLPSVDELMGAAGEAVMCHGDLNDGNLMGLPVSPHFEPTGVIDFNQGFVGHRLADVGAIWWHILERDPGGLDAFLIASGLHTLAHESPRQALAWTLMTPVWTAPVVKDLATIDDPEELAARWFGER